MRADLVFDPGPGEEAGIALVMDKEQTTSASWAAKRGVMQSSACVSATRRRSWPGGRSVSR